MVEIQNEANFRKSVLSPLNPDQRLNLFLGAGFSALAQDGKGRRLPLGGDLARELLRRFDIQYANGMPLSQIVPIIEHTRAAELRQFLTDRFTVGDFDERYYIVGCLDIGTVFTTNIDDLPHRIYAESPYYYLNDVYLHGPSYGDRSAVDFVPLHGCVTDENRPLRFGAIELATAFQHDPARWGYLADRLSRAPTLFWGYSMNDPGTLTAASLLKSRGDRWAVVLPDAGKGTTEYFRAMGFQLIRGDTAALLDYLIKLDEQRMAVPPPLSRNTRRLFPAEAVPDVSEVPRRSVIEFFTGAAPTWSDIYSDLVERSVHYNRIRNSLNAGLNVAMIGLPACGKTTLLMQLAAGADIACHKLITTGLTPDKAHWMLKKLDGEPALVFIDNFTDSISAVAVLAAADNVKIVGADRDYNFEAARHLLPLDNWDPQDVTELPDEDIQRMLASIPREIRKNSTTIRPQLAYQGSLQQPSLFEIVEMNLKGPTLRKRYESVLRQLKQARRGLEQVLLMMCYVQACRTPVSMDMVMGFARDFAPNHNKVYELVRLLGGMVADYFGELAVEPQDYFVPRSTIVGEAVLAAASAEDLRSMLWRFHRNVSILSICHYDIFIRTAYNNDLVASAFRDWQEGTKFYELIEQRDSTPYIHQQKALYLSKLGRFDEAFNAIDRAIVESGGRVWSIRNSHAIILFKANIRRPCSTEARDALRHSMDILTQCYESDRRKPYHACVYADQAIAYRRKYPDSVSVEFLKQALAWLESEASLSPWNRSVRRLLPNVRDALGLAQQPEAPE